MLLFIAGAISTLLLTPLFRIIAAKAGFMDVPANNHKGHKKATPLLGGLSLYTGWILCIISGIVVYKFGLLPSALSSCMEHLPGLLGSAKPIIFILTGATLAMLLGLIDDKIPMSASVKFAGQFIIALLAVIGGNLRLNLFIGVDWVAASVTVFWLMLLMNSINFFDNMDGLAIGTMTIAMAFFSVVAALNNQYFIASFTALTTGVYVGFWFYNANPASIFMGDSGSHFIGYLAAVVSAEITFFDISYSLSRFPILIPFFILALPLFDTFMVVMIRTLNKKPFWIGDHNHISHRFVKMGLTRKQAVLLVHLLAITIGFSSLPLFWGDFKTAAILTIQAFLILLVVTILQITLGNKSDTREK